MNAIQPVKSALALVGCMLALIAGCVRQASSPARSVVMPKVSIELRTTAEGKYVFAAVGLTFDVLSRVSGESASPEEQYRQFFVSRKGKLIEGEFHIEQDELRFTPHKLLHPGGVYEAHCWNPAFPRRIDDRASRQVHVLVTIPDRPPPASTVVTAVYPTSFVLPENLLKFYIHFSAPMSRGEAYRRIHLLDKSGEKIEAPFLELNEELWNADQTRFTIFFDPGRIKRELLPRELVGPALEMGKEYTLLIDADWLDAKGHPLKRIFEKALRVGPPDDKQPDLKTWQVTPPSAGSMAPVVVDFPEPMDHALLERVLRIIDEKGTVLAGVIVVSDEETRWQFTPEMAWAAGNYRLEVETILEDLAGNNLKKPFEVDLFQSIQKRVEAERVQIPFAVK